MSMQGITLENVFSEENIARAMRVMTRRDIMPGLDGMRTCELESFWLKNRKRILSDIETGNYTPTPLRQFYKRKPGKTEKRRISVCTVSDQMLQHCLRFEMERFFVPRFHPDSYGFIRKRSAAHALSKCLHYMNGGFVYAVDADIRKCFDSIKHRVVTEILKRAGCDRRVILLTEKYLKNPGMTGGRVRYNRVGLPQGSSISPVLCNLVLNRLDWHLAGQNLAFVRYADDLVVFCRTNREAECARNQLEQYLSGTLSLSLNEDKTSVCPVEKLTFLSHAFRKKDGRYELALDTNTAEKMQRKLLHHFGRSSTCLSERLNRIGAFYRGWLNYYCGINEEDLVVFITEVKELESREFCMEVAGRYTPSVMAYKDILCSNGYVMPDNWYDELKERGIVYGK
ncbi:MAG: hypothetical protein IJP92_15250 [Lachnospiraceae bacterium]|nr:hypothetical protein [Lachnospiraceae bacterium]